MALAVVDGARRLGADEPPLDRLLLDTPHVRHAHLTQGAFEVADLGRSSREEDLAPPRVPVLAYRGHEGEVTLPTPTGRGQLAARLLLDREPATGRELDHHLQRRAETVEQRPESGYPASLVLLRRVEIPQRPGGDDGALRLLSQQRTRGPGADERNPHAAASTSVPSTRHVASSLMAPSGTEIGVASTARRRSRRSPGPGSRIR